MNPFQARGVRVHCQYPQKWTLVPHRERNDAICLKGVRVFPDPRATPSRARASQSAPLSRMRQTICMKPAQRRPCCFFPITVELGLAAAVFLDLVEAEDRRALVEAEDRRALVEAEDRRALVDAEDRRAL